METAPIEKKAFHEELKADESKVPQLRERFLELMVEEELDESEVRHVIEAGSSFVKRCLIACYNDEKKAYKLGAESLRWRSNFKPSKVTVDDFPIAAGQDSHAFCAPAKDGHAVVLARCKFWHPWKYTTEEHYKMLAFIMETCQKTLDPDDENSRVYIICDMKDMSKLDSHIGKIAALAKTIRVYYPESSVGVAVNADLLTQVLWGILSPLIDKRTRDRVSIFRENHFQQEFLENQIGLENLGPALGGSRKEEWTPISAESVEAYLAEYGRE